MSRLRTSLLCMLLAGALTTAPAAAAEDFDASTEGKTTIGTTAAQQAAAADTSAQAAAAETHTKAVSAQPALAAAPAEPKIAEPPAVPVTVHATTPATAHANAPARAPAQTPDQAAAEAEQTVGAAPAAEAVPAGEAAAAASAADEDVPVRSLANEPESRLVGFIPSVALVRPLHTETDLPAMQISLGLVNFVGEVDTAYPGEDAFAILPLGHDAVVEVYELSYDGMELIQPREPSVVRPMGANEAYVLRVPYFAGHPTREICVKTSGRKHCWRPGTGEMGDGFLSWKRTKGLD